MLSLTIAALILPLRLAKGQTGLTAAATRTCDPDSPLTTLSVCNELKSTITYCAGPAVASGAPFIECFCNQAVFNDYYEYFAPF
jgi:hypothetical protein